MTQPRKFSEKIALIQQKTLESDAEFDKILSEVEVCRGPNTLMPTAGVSPPCKGLSMPNVSHIPCQIDLQGALNNLQDIKDRVGDNRRRHRTSSGYRRPLPPEKKIDSYTNYLSPPSSDWRRTSSDSALYQSVGGPMGCGAMASNMQLESQFAPPYLVSPPIPGLATRRYTAHDICPDELPTSPAYAWGSPGNAQSGMGAPMHSADMRPRSCETGPIGSQTPQSPTSAGIPGIPSVLPQSIQQNHFQPASNLACQLPTAPFVDSSANTGFLPLPNSGNSSSPHGSATGSLPDLTSLQYININNVEEQTAAYLAATGGILPGADSVPQSRLTPNHNISATSPGGRQYSMHHSISGPQLHQKSGLTSPGHSPGSRRRHPHSIPSPLVLSSPSSSRIQPLSTGQHTSTIVENKSKKLQLTHVAKISPPATNSMFSPPDLNALPPSSIIVPNTSFLASQDTSKSVDPMETEINLQPASCTLAQDDINLFSSLHDTTTVNSPADLNLNLLPNANSSRCSVPLRMQPSPSSTPSVSSLSHSHGGFGGTTLRQPDSIIEPSVLVKNKLKRGVKSNLAVVNGASQGAGIQYRQHSLGGSSQGDSPACPSPTSPLSSYSPCGSPGLSPTGFVINNSGQPPVQGSMAHSDQMAPYYMQQQAMALQHTFERINMGQVQTPNNNNLYGNKFYHNQQQIAGGTSTQQPTAIYGDNMDSVMQQQQQQQQTNEFYTQTQFQDQCGSTHSSPQTAATGSPQSFPSPLGSPLTGSPCSSRQHSISSPVQSPTTSLPTSVVSQHQQPPVPQPTVVVTNSEGFFAGPATTSAIQLQQTLPFVTVDGSMLVSGQSADSSAGIGPASTSMACAVKAGRLPEIVLTEVGDETEFDNNNFGETLDSSDSTVVSGSQSLFSPPEKMTLDDPLDLGVDNLQMSADLATALSHHFETTSNVTKTITDFAGDTPPSETVG